MSNPFIFDRPVPANELIDRGEELTLLVGLAEGGHNVRLVSPRRYGKTTLLRRVLLEADRIGFTTVYADLSGVQTVEDVFEVLDPAYDVFRGVGGRSTSALRRRGVRIAAKIAGWGAEVETQGAVAARMPLRRLLDLPVKHLRTTGKRALVALDEFQEVMHVAGGVDGVLRSAIQHHGDAASYIFAGSHPSLMAELFARQERPLFGQARGVTLGPLPAQDLAVYVAERLGLRDGSDERVQQLCALARGHPQRAMLLAHHLWEAVHSQDSEADVWLMAQAAAMSELDDGFRVAWDQYGSAEKEGLLAIAAGRPVAEFIADRFRHGGEAILTQKGLATVDPLLEKWLLDVDAHVGCQASAAGGEGAVRAEAMLLLLRDGPSEFAEPRAREALTRRLGIELYEAALLVRGWGAADEVLSAPERLLLHRSRRMLVGELSRALEIDARAAEELLVESLAPSAALERGRARHRNRRRR